MVSSTIEFPGDERAHLKAIDHGERHFVYPRTISERHKQAVKVALVVTNVRAIFEACIASESQ